MTHEECYKILKQYNKWRRGKGKKYAQPGFPFDTKEIGLAIDKAISCVRAVVKAERILEKDELYEQTRENC